MNNSGYQLSQSDGSNKDMAAAVHRITGHDAAAVIAGSGANTSSSNVNSLASPPVTVDRGNCLVLVVCTWGLLNRFSAYPSGTTGIVNQAVNRGSNAQARKDGPAGAGNTGASTWGWNTADTAVATTLAIRPPLA